MNWGQFKSAILSRLHDTTLVAKIPDWYNEVLLEVVSAADWRHLDASTILPTTAPYTTGTATTVNGSATVTFSGATIPITVTSQLFVCEGRYYKIASRNSATQITLGSNYIGAGGSGLAYKIYFYALTPPSDFATPKLYEAMIQTGSSSAYLLVWSSNHDLFSVWADEASSTGRPTNCRFFNEKILLWPVPDAAYNVQIFYHRLITEFSISTLDATELDWPTDMIGLILQGVLAVGFEYIDDSLTANARSRFVTLLNAQVSRNNRRPGIGNARFNRWDGGAQSTRIPYRLPEPIG